MYSAMLENVNAMSAICWLQTLSARVPSTPALPATTGGRLKRA